MNLKVDRNKVEIPTAVPMTLVAKYSAIETTNGSHLSSHNGNKQARIFQKF